MSTLLEQAKAIQPYRRLKNDYSPEHVELAVAWASGEVTLGQVLKLLKISPGSNCYNFLSLALRKAVQDGILVKAK